MARPFATTLNRRVTLQRPVRAATSAALTEAVTYPDLVTVRAAYRPMRPGEVIQSGGSLQAGGSILTIRRPVQVGGVEVVPDVAWRAVMEEAGVDRTLHVEGVMDATAEKPSVRVWQLFCSGVRVPA